MKKAANKFGLSVIVLAVAFFATVFFATSCMEHDMYYIPELSAWLGTPVPGLTVADKFSWLSDNAESGESYLIEFNADEIINSPSLSAPSGVEDITVHLKGNGKRRTLKRANAGSLFEVGSGVTLVLDNNITLAGLPSIPTNPPTNPLTPGNNAPVVSVKQGGKLRMNSGSKIIGNTTSMNGGGVSVENAEFTLSGGEISGNTVSKTGASGGGVYVNGGTFNMTSGTISGNTATSGGGTSCGGGVYVESGVFTMTGGTISGNTAYSGGGVGVRVNGTFIKTSGGTISNNTATVGKTAVIIDSTSPNVLYQRNANAGTGVNMDSTKIGSAGGWE